MVHAKKSHKEQVARSIARPGKVFYMLSDPSANDGVVSPGSCGISGARATPSATINRVFLFGVGDVASCIDNQFRGLGCPYSESSSTDKAHDDSPVTRSSKNPPVSFRTIDDSASTRSVPISTRHGETVSREYFPGIPI